jgi:hypothetical protein
VEFRPGIERALVEDQYLAEAENLLFKLVQVLLGIFMVAVAVALLLVLRRVLVAVAVERQLNILPDLRREIL